MSLKQGGGTPKRIGLLAELTGGVSLAPLIAAAIEHLEDAGIETCVLSSGQDVSSERLAWDLLSRNQCDGFILHSDVLSTDDLVHRQSNRRNTVVISIDDHLVGQLAARMVLEQSSQRIAMVTGPPHRFSVQRRSHGFVKELNTSADPSVGFEICHSAMPSVASGREIMARMLSSQNPPTAVFFHHELMALGAKKLCRERQLRSPEDIFIVTCSTSDLMDELEPSLGQIRLPLEDIGRYAAKKVLAEINSVSPTDTFLSSTSSWPAPFVVEQSVITNSRKTSRDVDQTISNSKLSVRERECLQWAAKGKTSWEISQILSITESTVIYHLRNATRKLNAANRIHAVTKALQASLIEF